MLDAANEPPAAAATPPATPAQSPAPSTMKTVKDKVADTAKEIKGNPRLVSYRIPYTRLATVYPVSYRKTWQLPYDWIVTVYLVSCRIP